MSTTTPMNWIKTFALLALLPLVAACSDHPLYVSTPELTLDLEPDSVTLWSIGATVEMPLIARSSDGGPVSPPLLAWQSADPGVAEVDSRGRVAAREDGMTTVWVRAGDAAEASATVRVDASIEQSAWVSTVENPLSEGSVTRDSTAIVVHDSAGSGVGGQQ